MVFFAWALPRTGKQLSNEAAPSANKGRRCMEDSKTKDGKSIT
jgi:hypothetical protein